MARLLIPGVPVASRVGKRGIVLPFTVGTDGVWGLAGAPTKGEAVDDGPIHDGDSSYVQGCGNTANCDQRFRFNLSVPVKKPFIIHAWARNTLGNYINPVQLFVLGNAVDVPGSAIDTNLNYIPGAWPMTYAKASHRINDVAYPLLQSIWSIILRSGINGVSDVVNVTSIFVETQ